MTLGGSGGTARTLKKINQDNYSAEYLERTSTDEIRCKIRHTVESQKDGEYEPLERHNVELTRIEFGINPDGSDMKRVISYTIRAGKSADQGASGNLAYAMSYWTDTTSVPALLGWES